MFVEVGILILMVSEDISDVMMRSREMTEMFIRAKVSEMRLNSMSIESMVSILMSCLVVMVKHRMVKETVVLLVMVVMHHVVFIRHLMITVHVVIQISIMTCIMMIK